MSMKLPAMKTIPPCQVFRFLLFLNGCIGKQPPHSAADPEAMWATAISAIKCLPECVFHRPLGLESGDVKDSQLSCSHENEYTGWYSVWGPGRARLNAQGFGCAWLALHQDAQQWVQIDVDGARFISGIIVQGRCDADEWVTKFALDYRSESHQKWICCKDHNGNNRVFYGNTDRSGSVQSLLRPPVMASSLRVRPLQWHSRIALRLEVLECLTKCKAMSCERCSTHPPQVSPDFTLLTKQPATPQLTTKGQEPRQLVKVIPLEPVTRSSCSCEDDSSPSTTDIMMTPRADRENIEVRLDRSGYFAKVPSPDGDTEHSTTPLDSLY